MKRNWGGVVIAVAGAFELAASVLNLVARSIPDFPTNLFGTITALELSALVLVPIALIVGFAPLAFGGSGLVSIAGPGLRSRLLVFFAALVGALAQYGLILLAVPEIGPDESAAERATSASLMIEVFALLLALVGGIAIARSGVARGYARWSLIVAALLIAVTLVLGYTQSVLYWQDVPRAVGLVALGLSYWRVGLARSAVDAPE